MLSVKYLTISPICKLLTLPGWQNAINQRLVIERCLRISCVMKSVWNKQLWNTETVDYSGMALC